MSHPLFKFFASLKLAVFSILSLAAVLGTATVLESIYGTRAAHVMVYGTWWFTGLLLMLGTNVFCAALSRFPWKRRQTGFVITHLGILTLLFGAFLTQQWGIDGNMPVEEGKNESEALLSDLTLTVSEEDRARTAEYAVPETGLASAGRLFEVKFSENTSLVVERYLPRVTMERNIVASPVPGLGSPAVQVELSNDRFTVEEWLVASNPKAPAEINLGPAVLTFKKAWSKADVEEFHRMQKKGDAPNQTGKLVLIAYFAGKEYRLDVREAQKGWRPLGGSGLELKVDRYLPYAVVEGNELVTRSAEPVNPAVQLSLQGQAKEGKAHGLF